MVAMMLTYQPLLISGINDTEASITNAYGAMAMFIFTFLMSVVYLIQDGLTSSNGRGEERRRRGSAQEYEGIPQGTGPAVLQDYALSLDLPESVQEGVFS
jgi:hypothetical protein